ncbi:MAG: NAD-dependent epimerase/dehydratase family protein [Planctomycetes bacterium]|nr:NAD-dependent epimerase/dehydratase family protein [Planctomycetota bacterium]
MALTILVTGGRGFFGRRIVEALRAHGHEVAAPGRPEFDLLDPVSVARTLKVVRPHTVVHSAAYYGGLGICVAEPARIFHDNVLMAAHLLDGMAAAGSVKRFVSIGSACAYPGAVAGDMNESDFWAGALHPSVEAYGFTKKVQLVGARAYARQHGWTVQCPQITNLYGEHDVFTEYRSHVAAALIKKFADAKLEHKPEVVCWGTGAPVREFLYSGDAAEGVARLLETDYAEPLNIGTGIGTSIKELSEVTARVTGFEGRIVWDTSKPDGVLRKVLDVSRMKQILNWQPPTSLEAGLKKTVDWYLANKEAADART